MTLLTRHAQISVAWAGAQGGELDFQVDLDDVAELVKGLDYSGDDTGGPTEGRKCRAEKRKRWRRPRRGNCHNSKGKKQGVNLLRRI